MKRPPTNDEYPMPSRGEPVPGRQPAGFDELDWPDEIELELGPLYRAWGGAAFYDALGSAGLARDVAILGLAGARWVAVTCQAEDVWYAGVPRDRKLTLRRL